jgi:ribosome-binding factor A
MRIAAARKRMVINMAGYRRGRINEQLTKDLAEIIQTVKDPRVSESFISITGVECSADLKNAKIYFSALGNNIDINEIKKGLVSATGYMRGQVAQRLNLRITPELRFVLDESIEKGAHMSALLRQIQLKEDADDKAETDTDE